MNHSLTRSDSMKPMDIQKCHPQRQYGLAIRYYLIVLNYLFPALELEMTRLPAEIHRKPSCWTKYRDTSILAKWRAEAIPQANPMNESRFNYVLEEPEGYANLRDEVSSAEVRARYPLVSP
jgi:hypothetical protein